MAVGSADVSDGAGEPLSDGVVVGDGTVGVGTGGVQWHSGSDGSVTGRVTGRPGRVTLFRGATVVTVPSGCTTTVAAAAPPPPVAAGGAVRGRVVEAGPAPIPALSVPGAPNSAGGNGAATGRLPIAFGGSSANTLVAAK